MKYLFYSMVLSISLAGGACAPSLVQPAFSLQEIELTGVSFSTVDLAFKVKVTNPNSAAVNLDQLKYQLELNEITLGSGELLNPVYLPATGSQVATLPFSSSFSGMTSILQVLLGENEVRYKLSGKAVLSKFLFKREFPFTSSGIVPVNRSTFHH